MAAHLVGKPVVGAPGEVHATAKNIIGTKCEGYDANGAPAEYIYLYGNTGITGAGQAVTYDEAGATTLLAANAKGPVAWSTADVDAATEAGWFLRETFGGQSVSAAASSADNATVGRETTDGLVGDGRSAGDQIVGAISRGASASGAQLIQVQSGAWVDDFQGA